MKRISQLLTKQNWKTARQGREGERKINGELNWTRTYIFSAYFGSSWMFLNILTRKEKNNNRPNDINLLVKEQNRTEGFNIAWRMEMNEKYERLLRNEFGWGLLHENHKNIKFQYQRRNKFCCVCVCTCVLVQLTIS